VLLFHLDDQTVLFALLECSAYIFIKLNWMGIIITIYTGHCGLSQYVKNQSKTNQPPQDARSLFLQTESANRNQKVNDPVIWNTKTKMHAPKNSLLWSSLPTIIYHISIKWFGMPKFHRIPAGLWNSDRLFRILHSYIFLTGPCARHGIIGMTKNMCFLKKGGGGGGSICVN